IGRGSEQAALGIHIIRHSPDMAERVLVELDIGADPVFFPKAAARLKEGPRSRVVRNCRDRITLALRPAGMYWNLPQHNGRHATNQILRLHGLFFVRLAIADAHAARAVLDSRDWSCEPDAVDEPRSERIGHHLVPALQAENLGRK